MTPDMSVGQMLDSFIYIVKGSRVIDRRAIDWGEAAWWDEKLVRHFVFSVTDIRRYFAHRRTKWRDPFNEWFVHPSRFTASTLFAAMRLADDAANGRLAPVIDVDAIVRNASTPLWATAPSSNRQSERD